MNLICIFKICLLHILLVYTDALSIEKCKTSNCQSGNDLKKNLSANSNNATKDKQNSLFNQLSDHLKDKTILETQLNDQPTIKTTESSEQSKIGVSSTVSTIKHSNNQLNRQALNAKDANEHFKGARINLIDKSKRNEHQSKQRTKREPRGGRIGGKGNSGGIAGKRAGAKQDGQDDGDGDSGTSTMRPIFLLVSLSILFLFI